MIDKHDKNGGSSVRPLRPRRLSLLYRMSCRPSWTRYDLETQWCTDTNHPRAQLGGLAGVPSSNSGESREVLGSGVAGEM